LLLKQLRDAMPQKVNYYAVLSRAVASLDRDAYGARGAVYDREHRAMLRRLALANPRCTEQEVAEEEQAFRDAIRRIEFPEPVARAVRAEPAEPRREERTIAWREPEREPPGRVEREGRREREPQLRESRWRRDADAAPEREPRSARIEPPQRVVSPQRAVSAQRAVPAYEPEGEEEWEEQLPPEHPGRKSIFRRVVLGTQIAVLVGGLGLVGYALWSRDIDLSGLLSLPDAMASSQRAALYEAGAANAKPVVGKATWQTRTRAAEQGGKPATVIVLDAQIPERQIALTMSISQEAEGGGMSHMFELQFARPESLPFGGIAGVPKIVMKSSETEVGDDLIGTSIPVDSGRYLFGLLSTPDALMRNIEALRSKPWMGILMNFQQGPAQMLNVEKGGPGKRAITDALAKWGQGQ
jgi:hypothetical protein